MDGRGSTRRLVAGIAALAALTVPTIAHAEQAPQFDATTNWAGYIAQHAYYTGVSALFQAPTPLGAQRLGAIGSWVGVGGSDTPDLIQAGVGVLGQEGETSYSAWYEMLPEPSHVIPMTIGPGDWVSVDIHETANNQWLITLVDGSQVFQHSFMYASSHTSAEWIVEEPSLATGHEFPLQLSNSTNFSRMSAIANGQKALPTQLSPQASVIVSPRGQLRASPSPLGKDGASFSVAVQ